MSTPNLDLPEIAAAQAQKHVTHNEALLALDALVQLAVVSRRIANAPGTPGEGARYIVPLGAAGDFAGQDGKVASFAGGAWSFYQPLKGWRAFIQDENGFSVFDGTTWTGPEVARLSSTVSGAESRIVTIEEELTLSGSSVQSSIVIPNRAIVFGVSTRTTDAISGPFNYHCGISGEPEKFGGYLGIAFGSTNAGVIGPQAFYSDTPVVITANGGGGAFTGGKVRIALHYFLPVVPQR